MQTLIVGVAGGTGSGKTTLTRALLEKCEGPPSVLYHDNYYRRQDELTYEERERVNYDDLDAFDNDLFVEHLRTLRAGNAVESPIYDFSIHNRSNETTMVEPAPVVIVEGILIFAEARICELLDIKLFVDTDADVRLLRRIKRDVVDRGRTLQSVEEQYLGTVKPMHELYVEPSKRNADIIIPDGGHNIVAMDMILGHIQAGITQAEIS
ncbi:uridine kinase [Brevibacterium sp.]|uniref:uridine kinase n=1 Tax=Brevibacterium sp. TaxID=1701 RepID=UPI002811DC34|nr:uridine kinase [Brevibacterium sp.]